MYCQLCAAAAAQRYSNCRTTAACCAMSAAVALLSLPSRASAQTSSSLRAAASAAGRAAARTAIASTGQLGTAPPAAEDSLHATKRGHSVQLHCHDAPLSLLAPVQAGLQPLQITQGLQGHKRDKCPPMPALRLLPRRACWANPPCLPCNWADAAATAHRSAQRSCSSSSVGAESTRSGSKKVCINSCGVSRATAVGPPSSSRHSASPRTTGLRASHAAACRPEAASESKG
jgi:hypothetical protein